MSLQGVFRQVVGAVSQRETSLSTKSIVPMCSMSESTSSPLSVCELCSEKESKCQCHLPREVCEAVYAPINYEEEPTTCQGDEGILVRPVIFNNHQKDIYHFVHLNPRGSVRTLMISDFRRSTVRHTICENTNEMFVAMSNAVGYWVPSRTG